MSSIKIIIKNPERIDVLVNKKRSLPANYIPTDLVNIEVLHKVEKAESKMLRKEAAAALTELFVVAKLGGFEFWAISGFRSYDRQLYLFKEYAKKHGEEKANRFSARPGQSEHQTGLTMDVSIPSLDYKLVEKLGETPEGKWLAYNAHIYGFIIRYPKGTEHITGYQYEPWHIRYLGKNLARKVFESKLTYDEYYSRFFGV
ncbi:MAG: M15 family metallopeptidase [Tissierellia bacterium]|nr:M15 family metallopeptidase [Tissierellia bacterium]